MDNREIYDLSNEIRTVGKIGRLQTLDVIPVVAGDSFEMQFDAVLRMAATRREVASELQTKIAVFYVKHRHVYGSTWRDFVKQGLDETYTWTGYNVAASYRDASFLALASCPATLPKWRVEGYNRIYDRYWKVPSTYSNGQDGHDDTANFAFFPTNETGSDEYRQYGKLLPRLPHVLNGMNLVSDALTGTAGYEFRDLTDADAQVAAASTLDIRELEQIKARYKSELETSWFASFYSDIMNKRFGTTPNRDADERPELCFVEKSWISGHDVDGHDDATHGSVIGKTTGRIGFNMPRKTFDEHGALWIMLAVRPPMVHVDETHPLDFVVNPSAKQLLTCDPAVWAAEPPVQFDPREWTNSNHDDGISTVKQAYGQHFRFHPNRTHPRFNEIPGYFVSKHTDTTLNKYWYHFNNEYDDCFQSWQMAHFQVYGSMTTKAFRHVPAALSSIYSGA